MGDLAFTDLTFTPYIPIPIIFGLGLLLLAIFVLGILRSAKGAFMRLLAGSLLVFALLNPTILKEDRTDLSDIILVVIDESASQTIGERIQQTNAAIEKIKSEINKFNSNGSPEVEVRTITVADSDKDGTLLIKALQDTAAEISPERLSAAIIVSDGRIDDYNSQEFPVPIHLLLTGEKDEKDRRLILKQAPGFGLVGKSASLQFNVEDKNGNISPAEVTLTVDGIERLTQNVTPNQDITLDFDIDHGGANVVELTIKPLENELTERNNSATFTVNGVRDRMRVLLVSGEPHAGERTWRNLLKADPAVDLVHFTILRSPEKQNNVPRNELALIAFPTRELFQEKLDQFDLIIFDRYRRRGVLPSAYITNIANYVKQGGAVLMATGPAFSGTQSLYRSPLAAIIPARPNPQVINQGYHPKITETGQRHPVTSGLTKLAPRKTAEDGTPGWGRWFRLNDVEPERGHVVMAGANEKPLLILDRVEEGRVALLASDHAWLWARGYEGGGPQAELLRRVSHWLMKEPELEENSLTASVEGTNLIVTNRSVDQDPITLEIKSPSGKITSHEWSLLAPGEWRSAIETSEQGIYHLTQGDLKTIVAVGPPAPKEFENPISTSDILRPFIDLSNGSSVRISDGIPSLRRIRANSVTNGRNWIGLPKKNAYRVNNIALIPLAPAWAMLILALGLISFAWWREGK